jgi:bacillithiol system protein YtxJ
MEAISSLDQVKETRFFLFKHSNTCPISRSAHRAVSEADSAATVPIYMVVVQENRQLSNEIAQKFNVVHESPQLLLIEDERVVWHDSHYGITRDAILAKSTTN